MLYKEQKLWLVRTGSGILTHLATGDDKPGTVTLCGPLVDKAKPFSVAPRLGEVKCKKCKKIQRIPIGYRTFSSALNS